MSGFGGSDAVARTAGVILGQRLPTRPFSGPQAATVIAATTYTLTFKLKSLPDVNIGGYDQILFGPAPYTRPAVVPVADDPNTPMIPPPGTECRVDFVGYTLNDPFVVMFVNWP